MNSRFGRFDCSALFVSLMEWRPRRMIELGSGYSTLLSASITRRFLGGQMWLPCIEPYPCALLTQPGGLPGMTELLVDRVGRVGLAPMSELDGGDVLFYRFLARGNHMKLRELLMFEALHDRKREGYCDGSTSRSHDYVDRSWP